jgi:hypothetical protein
MSDITEKDFETVKTVYMVVMNLTGLHEKVYTLNRKKDDICPMWVDKSGDECFEPNGEKAWGWNVDSGRVEFITQNKDIAEGVLNTLRIYKAFIANRL